jgi:Domain of unknown function (DUF5130)
VAAWLRTAVAADPGEPVEVPVATGNEQHPARRDHSPEEGNQPELAPGEAVVGTGRISAARQIKPVLPVLPFSRAELATLDDELVRASRAASVHFGIYLGDLGPDTRTRAEELHDSMGDWADNAVLVAVSPGQRVIEVVTGCRAANRLPDRRCKLAVESMVSLFKDGDLAGGLSSGLRMLADHAES